MYKYNLWVRKKGNKRWIKQVSSPFGAKKRAEHIRKTIFPPEQGYQTRITKVKVKERTRRLK